ncbi:MAG: hypothetical protein V8R78_04575, partial [Evtepia gabavorous]
AFPRNILSKHKLIFATKSKETPGTKFVHCLYRADWRAHQAAKTRPVENPQTGSEKTIFSQEGTLLSLPDKPF